MRSKKNIGKKLKSVERKIMSKEDTKRSQVWVETVIYALIGLTLISIILSIATPQIQKVREKGIIDQTTTAMLELNKAIIGASDVSGNVRIIDFKLSSGKLEINPSENKISYILENTNLKLSEPNDPNEINPIIIREGDLFIKTFEYGERYNLFLELDYNSTLNLTQNLGSDIRTLHVAGVPYKIKIENVGDHGVGEPVHLDISVV